MRRLRRLIIGLLLLTSGGWLLLEAWAVYDNYQQAKYRSAWIDQGVSSTGYVLTEQSWLEFEIPDQQPVIRVLSNASLRHDQWVMEDEKYHYQIEYQILDDEGNVLSESLYYQRSHVSQPKEDELLGVIPRQFYTESELLPADGRVMMLNLHNLQQPSRLRLRLYSQDPGIVDVIVRCYLRESVADHKLAYQWARTSERKRDYLARGSIYDHELLTDLEKRNLLKNNWQPVGPKGVRGKDYHDRTLYTLRNYDELFELQGEDIQPSGLWIDRWVNGMVSIPYGGGEVELLFAALDPNQPMAGEVHLHWSGPGINNQQQFVVPVAQGEGRFQAALANGIVEIRSQLPLKVQAYLTVAGQRLEITPEVSYLRGYAMSATEWVEFQLEHYAGQSMPARFDFRRNVIDPAVADDRPAVIDYEVLDRHGEVLRRGSMDYQFHFSHYDRSMHREWGYYLSLPQRHYFNFDSQAQVVRFRSSNPLLVSGYSRPYDLPLLTRVPMDYFGQHADEQPSWFVMLPANRERLVKESRDLLMRLQSAPPQDDPRLLKGEYQWLAYRPDGEWLARDLLLPREPGLPMQPHSLGAVFHHLQANKNYRLMLKGADGLTQLYPTLFYQRYREEPTTLKILLDGVVWYQVEVAQLRGELPLPMLPAGEHQLEIVADAETELFLNYIQGDKPLIRRLSNRFEGTRLSVNYTKLPGEAAILSGLWHVAAHRRAATRLEVTIEVGERPKNQPLPGWTIHRRIYQLQPNNRQRTALWGTQRQWLDGGQRFFIAMENDMPAGEYRITLQQPPEREGYLSLSQLKPGAVALERRFNEAAGYE